jgi:Calcineurin-like phosphoesterase
VNVFSSCKVEGDNWHRIEKDLYLGSAYFSSAYVDIQSKKEEELKPDDKVILDITVGRLDPSTGKNGEGDERWESKPEGIWVKRSAKRHASDEKTAVTGVDVLFGPDAVDPREGWKIKDTPLLLGSGEAHQARLSIRRGTHSAPEKPIPRIGENGRFKILQVADLHLSTGVGECRDAMPEDGRKCEADLRTLDFIGKMLDEEKPDLVVLSGDQVNGDTAKDAQTVWTRYLLFMIASNSLIGNFQICGTVR